MEAKRYYTKGPAKKPTKRQLDMIRALKDGPLDYYPLFKQLFEHPRGMAQVGGRSSGFDRILGGCRENGWVDRVGSDGRSEPKLGDPFRYALTDAGREFLKEKKTDE